MRSKFQSSSEPGSGAEETKCPFSRISPCFLQFRGFEADFNELARNLRNEKQIYPFFIAKRIATATVSLPQQNRLLYIGRTPRGSCNRTLLRRVLRRFFEGSASQKGS